MIFQLIQCKFRFPLVRNRVFPFSCEMGMNSICLKDLFLTFFLPVSLFPFNSSIRVFPQHLIASFWTSFPVNLPLLQSEVPLYQCSPEGLIVHSQRGFPEGIIDLGSFDLFRVIGMDSFETRSADSFDQVEAINVVEHRVNSQLDWFLYLFFLINFAIF